MNVILIIFDSLRKDCIETFGQPPWGKVHTPNLVKFAEESFILGNCYPESLPTLPARRAMYTGKRVFPFNERNEYKSDFKGSPGWGPILEERTTISELLQMDDYTTCFVSDNMHQFKPSKNFHRGFDEWHYIRGYEHDYYTTGPLPRDEEIKYWLPEEVDKMNSCYKDFLTKALMNMNGRIKEEDYFVAKVMRKASNWLEQNYDKDKFFLMIEAWSPHETWFCPDYYREMYTKGKNLPQQVLSLYSDISHLPEEIIASTQANYSGVITMCDFWFGFLMNTIKKLNMLDDTLIVVTSDHGHTLGENNYLGKRGYPSTPEIFDIPVLLRHPDDSLGRGIENNILIQHTDITATILDIIGIKPRELEFIGTDFQRKKTKEKYSLEDFPEAKLHGKSFFNNLRNRDTKLRDHVTVGWGTFITVITDKWWLNCKVNGKGAFLYNLENSDSFRKNVADSNPEVGTKLFKLALDDAGGRFPDYLLNMANDDIDAPGCSELVAIE